MLAEFDFPADCMHGAEKLRDGGYRFFDAHSPFPIHGMDRGDGPLRLEARLDRPRLRVSGTFLAWLMMYWMNGVDYPLIVGGKPGGTLPSMIPIMFEVTVLFSALSAARCSALRARLSNRLRQHHQSLDLLRSRFKSLTTKFFLSVEVADPEVR